MDTKGQDALVIIKLYEIRSEALMREARAWFFSEFVPQSGKDIVALMLRRKAKRELPHGHIALGGRRVASQQRWDR